MTTRENRGGPRQPANPAAVSGPGALSQRTDGGPGNQKQPVRVASGGAYGERQAAVAQQQAAPMAAGGSAPAGGPGGATAAPGGPEGVNGVFGPTTMPNQPITAGVPSMMERQPDADMVLRELVQKFPSPWLMRLLRRRG